MTISSGIIGRGASEPSSSTVTSALTIGTTPLAKNRTIVERSAIHGVLKSPMSTRTGMSPRAASAVNGTGRKGRGSATGRAA